MQMKRQSEAEQFEKIPTIIYSDAVTASKQLAEEIANLIKERKEAGGKAVLGLATGSTPVDLYRELIRMHQEEDLGFQNVITFNLDEYYGLHKDHRESYSRYMHRQLFDHIDIPKSQIHIPDGTLDRDKVYRYCLDYEERIKECGGIDLQILGIGRSGHIGFNEPGSDVSSATRLVTLDALTRQDAARDFLGESNVPRFAITMGIGTIMRARKTVLMAWGKAKAAVVAEAVEGSIKARIPASYLQNHDRVCFMIDGPAANELTRTKHPWLVTSVDWTPKLMRKAAIWLSKKVEKPVLKLVESDYTENGLAQLITHVGSAYHLNISIFNDIQHTITGWPGGKPNADDSTRPEKASPFPKKVLILAPEPMDAIASLGGSLHRLVDQNHDVRVVYQTSGNLAVPDEEVEMAADLILDAADLSRDTSWELTSFAADVRRKLRIKNQLNDDTRDIRAFKSLIRRGEARAACRICGLNRQNVAFLDQEFYEIGCYRNFSITEQDVDQLANEISSTEPHQIYVTGNLADPNSVAGACFQVFKKAVAKLVDEPWMQSCSIWLYRGNNQEWNTHEVDMAIPLSPDELKLKIKAVYQHQSQRSQSPLNLRNHHEFWQQIESANRQTANAYDKLGMAEYEAIESFQRFLSE